MPGPADPSLAPLWGLLWLTATLIVLLVVQRWLQLELQSLFLLLTRQPKVAIGLAALLFFPGVLLHETSHFLIARLLGVRTGRFSLLPQPLPNGKLRLGYVEVAQAGVLRDALIGVAPLLAGGAVVAYIGMARLGLPAVAARLMQGDLAGGLTGLEALPGTADFWLWFYLAFAISTTMFPSASDRRSWLPVAGVVLLAAGAALLAGAGPWLALHVFPGLERVLSTVTVIFGISLTVDLLLAVPAWLLRVALSRAMGVRLVRV